MNQALRIGTMARYGGKTNPNDKAWTLLLDTKNSLDVYTKWADEYDHDVMDVLGCASKEELVKSTMANVKNDTSTLLLDVAAGSAPSRTIKVTTSTMGRYSAMWNSTGIIADILRRSHFKGIMDALEPNVAMLKKAENKATYRKYICFEVTPHEDLPVNNGTYDAVTIAGGFIPGHLKPECLWPITKCLKSGGLMAFYADITKSYGEYGSALKKVLKDMVDGGKVELIKEEKVLAFTNRKEADEDLLITLFVYRKL